MKGGTNLWGGENFWLKQWFLSFHSETKANRFVSWFSLIDQQILNSTTQWTKQPINKFTGNKFLSSVTGICGTGNGWSSYENKSENYTNTALSFMFLNDSASPNNYPYPPPEESVWQHIRNLMPRFHHLPCLERFKCKVLCDPGKCTHK